MEFIWENIKQQLNIQKMDERTYSPLALAFIGDSVYDLLIRTMVVSQGNRAPQKLHKDVREYVKATYQASMIEKLEPLLTDEELGVYKRGRNAKSGTVPKNTDVITYKMATGFEALIGYLYIQEKFQRVVELIAKGIKDE